MRRFILVAFLLFWLVVNLEFSYAGFNDIFNGLNGEAVSELGCMDDDCYNGLDIKLNLNKGWNIVPYFDVYSRINSDSYVKTEDIKRVYLYVPELKKNIQIYGGPVRGSSDSPMSFEDESESSIYTNKGMWLYSSRKGEISVKLSENVFPLTSNKVNLIEGWNLIIITPDYEGSDLRSLQQDCEIQKVFVWDSVSKSWKKMRQDFKIGSALIWKGLLLKLENNCKLGNAQDNVIASQKGVCSSFEYSDWSNCTEEGKQTRQVIVSYPSGCQGGNPSITRDCVILPLCKNSDWKSEIFPEECPESGEQTKVWINVGNCQEGVQKPESEDIECTFSLVCNSFTYSNWSTCSESGTQTRSVITSSPSGCQGGNPEISRTCTYVAPCMESNWQANVLPSICPTNGKQIRNWSKIGNCAGGVQKQNSENVSCNYITPSCNSFTYSNWSTCSESGTQTRSVITSSPSGCQGGNPNVVQVCSPPCTENSWSKTCYYGGKTYSNCNFEVGGTYCAILILNAQINIAKAKNPFDQLSYSRAVEYRDKVISMCPKISYAWEWKKTGSCAGGVQKPLGVNSTLSYVMNSTLGGYD